MPYVNIKVAGTLTRKQKEELALEVTSALERIANKPKAHTYVVFEEVDRENWAVGDQLLG